MNSTYTVTFVHPIAGACPNETVKVNTIPGSAFSNKLTLAAALRSRGILFGGQSIREMRVEANRVIVFPTCKPGGWHSITLTAQDQGIQPKASCTRSQTMNFEPTYQDILELGREAAEWNDLAQVRLCEDALRDGPGSGAWLECVRVLREADGQS